MNDIVINMSIAFSNGGPTSAVIRTITFSGIQLKEVRLDKNQIQAMMTTTGAKNVIGALGAVVEEATP